LLSAVGIIPARYESSRFPGKSLAQIAGKSMIQHVYERARRAASLDEVLVATDSLEILRAVEKFGGRAVMTDAGHATGTDRIAEVAAGLEAVDVIVNIQGDEPLIDPAAIDAVAAPLLENTKCQMSSAMTRLSVGEASDPNVVKVVTDREGRALYFSRVPIPGTRSAAPDPKRFRRHLGLYAYRRDFLLRLTRLERTPLERHEELEQLRALENGHSIQMVELTDDRSIGVDTPEDLELVRARLKSGQPLY
jgi:3-deoxy-manno-octulosonate cytidylyltransferase (CMP-KDO synthetase)